MRVGKKLGGVGELPNAPWRGTRMWLGVCVWGCGVFQALGSSISLITCVEFFLFFRFACRAMCRVCPRGLRAVRIDDERTERRKTDLSSPAA